jgi:hypothetical protein
MSIIASLLGKLLRHAQQESDKQPIGLEEVMSIRHEDPVGEVDTSQLSFNVIKCVNGKIIKVSKYKRNPHGPDWTHELYIVKDDEKIPDVIGRILAIKALES